MKPLLLLALLFPLAASAQSPYVQGGAVNGAPDTEYFVLLPNGQPCGSWDNSKCELASYTYSFAQPLAGPCTVVVSLRQRGATISDSQKNSFASAVLGQGGELWYSTSCFSGPDTVTVTCQGNVPCWMEFTVSNYAGAWVPDQQSPQVIETTSADGWTDAITPTQNGELIIGFGSNHTTNQPTITAGTGWMLRANANEFIEDMLQTTAAQIASAVTYSASVNWCQTTVSFKPGNQSPPPFVWVMPGLGTATFPMQIPPACGPSDGTCSIQIQVCDTSKAPPVCMVSSQGTITLLKNITLPMPQQQSIPLVTVTP